MNSPSKRRTRSFRKKSPESLGANPIDDMPIPVKAGEKKTFEQILEEELAKQEAEAGKKPGIEDSVKKTFLKRKLPERSTAKKGAQTTAKKNYRYYVDNFS